MATIEELKKKPVVLELRCEDNDEEATLTREMDKKELAKMESWTVYRAVQKLLSYPYKGELDDYQESIKQYITNKKKDFNDYDAYTIMTHKGVINCCYDRDAQKVVRDERKEKKLLDYFIDATTNDNQEIWLAQLELTSPKILG